MQTAARAAALVLAGFSPVVMAQQVTYLPQWFIGTNLSGDGSVVVGNMIGAYETFRWTEQTGAVLLGEATAPVLGVAAGGPDVSLDGTRVSATILDETGTLATPGVWTEGSAWTRCIPPIAPDGRILDQALGSAWGISGDGSTVTGLYWYNMPDNSFGGARPFKWTQSGGIETLDITLGRNGRANTSNLDGSVAVGWEENDFGQWQPVVWRGTTRYQLSENDAFVGCEEVTSDGNTVVGQSYRPSTLNRVATRWIWNGASYDEHQLGLLPGTPPENGFAVAYAVSDDGSIIVGANFYTFFPGGSADGFIWTPTTGMMNADDFLLTMGIDVSSELQIRSVDGVSADGSTILVSGWDATTQLALGAVIRLPPPCPGDIADDFGSIGADGMVSFGDFLALLGLVGPCPGGVPGCDGDIADDFGTLGGDGMVSFGDFLSLLGLVGPCP